MLPIIGPTPNNGQSQSPTIQDNEDDPGESRADDSSSRADRDVKLDLNGSGDGNVHKDTARMMLEKNVSIQIEQQFSFSSSVSDTTESTQSDGEDGAEVSARRIISRTESLHAEFSARFEGEESEALEEFKQKAQEGIENGFQETRQEIGEDPSEAVQQLLSNVRTALDEFLEVFGSEGEESNGSESDGADNNAVAGENGADAAPEQQATEANRAAEGSSQIPPGLAGQIQGSSSEALTNFAG